MNLQNIYQTIAQYGCYHIDKNGSERISKTGDYIYNMDSSEEDIRTKQANFFKDFCGGAFLEMLKEKDTKDLLIIPQEWIDLAYETNPNKIPMTVYLGFDLCGSNFVINDLNADRATIAGFQPEIAAAFALENPSQKFRSFYDGLFKSFREYSGKSNPRVLILKENDDPYESMLSRFAKRMGFSVASIDNFCAKNVDIVFRTIRTHDTILQDPYRYRKLLSELKNGLPIINPLGASLAGHKGWITLLLHRNLVARNWFPESFLISPDVVMCSDGTTKDALWVEEVLLQMRKQFVVKNVFSAGGRGVFRGKDMGFLEWKKFWEKAMKGTHPVLIEKIQTKLLKDITVMNEDLKPNTKTLNLLQRIYTIYGTDEIFGEVFGGEGWKVNASGYTFPIAFQSLLSL